MEPIKTTFINNKGKPIQIKDLEMTLLRDNMPIQRTLGICEIKNPSINYQEKNEYKSIKIGPFGLFEYEIQIIQDKIGVDFMTNQSIYKKRKIISE
ncbi:MAG: hypothetical protein ACOC16_01460 [Nanoarchaeota archaeon]